MGSENIIRNMDDVTIQFTDNYHDVLSTLFGKVESIKNIILSNADTSLNEGTMTIHIDGDSTKVGISELSSGSTFVNAVAFANLSEGLSRSGHEPQAGKGEVVVIVLIDSDMPDSTMARAGITVNEGITAAIQDLGLAYDGLLASGATRQDIVIVRNRAPGMYLRGAGNHTKLGELIGRSTIEAVKRSAEENGTSIYSRMSVVELLSGYGYDQERLFSMSGCPDYSQFLVKILDKDSDPTVLAAVSATLHIVDCIRWGLVAEDVGMEAGIQVISTGISEPIRAQDLPETLAATVARYFMSG